MNKKYLFLGVCLILSGCSDNGFLFRSIGSYDVPKNRGVYLIGEPYEINNVRYVPHEDYDYFDSGDAFWYTANKNNPLTANGELYDSTKMTAMHRTLPLPSIVRITNLNNQTSAVVRVNDRGPFDNNRIIDVSEATAKYLNFSKNGVTPVQIEVLAMESKALKEELIGLKAKKGATIGEVAIDSNKILYPGMDAADIQNLKLDSTPQSTIKANAAPKEPTAAGLTYYQLKKNKQLPQTTPKQTVVRAINSPGGTASHSYQNNEIIYSGQNDTPKFYVQVGAFSKSESVQSIRQNLRSFPDLFIFDKMKGGQLLHYVRIGPYKTEAEAANVLDKVHASGYADSAVIFE